MMLHVMLLGRGQQGPSSRGLCGSTAAGLSVSRISRERDQKLHFCPVCRSLALKVAATGHETVCSVGATHD